MKTIDLENSYINNIYNKIKVLSYSHSIKIGKNNRHYYNVECLNCGEFTKMRNDKFNDYCKNLNCSKCQHFTAIKGCKNRHSEESIYKHIYSRYKYSAKKRNYSFNLTYNEFKLIIKENCHYCNAAPKESGSSKSINKTDLPVLHNGIDRVNNIKGYSSFNVVPCCSICNIMKQTLEYEEFLNHISNIHNFHKNK